MPLIRKEETRMMSEKARVRNGREFFNRYHYCLAALNAYITDARKICELLESCNGNAANALEQIDLMAQRDRENSSHSDYQRARKRLLHAAKLGSK
jgi:hypothetical protein